MRNPQSEIQNYMQIALQFHRAGQLPQAEAIYRQVLEQEPNNCQALHLLGIALCDSGRVDEAIAAYRRAIQLDPGSAAFHVDLGRALRKKRRLDEAIASYRKAIELQADLPEAYNNLGNALRDKGRLDEAVTAFQTAIQLRPDFAGAYSNLGNNLRDMGRLDEAIVACRRAIELKADLPEAHNNLGAALRDKGRGEEAIAAFRRAIQLRGNFAGAYSNLGAALREEGQLDEAIAALRNALRLQADLVEAYCNLGVALLMRGELDEALSVCQRAIQLRPDHAGAHWNKSLVLLLKGDFAQGWAEYEWRWQSKDFRSPRRDFPQPQWRGEDPSGRTILLHAEQGFGDTIQFIRYAPLLAGRGARVIVECQPELQRLLGGVEGIQHLTARGEPLPPFDLHTPLLSLPLAWGTRVKTIPGNVPYIKPDPALVGAWRGRLAGDSALKVGLVWAGSPIRKDDRYRSLPLSSLAPLAGVKGVSFYSLQKGKATEQAQNPPPGMNLIDMTEEIKDFADTAALISHLDLVITVDTAVAHLAGAMAKRVWTMLEFVPAWRWLLNREDSPWYPTMRLFRQPAIRDWATVIRRVAGELQNFCSSGARTK